MTTLSKEESETLIKEIRCLEIKVAQRKGIFFMKVIISRKERNNLVQQQAVCESLTENLKTQSKSVSEHLKTLLSVAISIQISPVKCEGSLCGIN
jgi:hypothetical protein